MLLGMLGGNDRYHGGASGQDPRLIPLKGRSGTSCSGRYTPACHTHRMTSCHNVVYHSYPGAPCPVVYQPCGVMPRSALVLVLGSGHPPPPAGGSTDHSAGLAQ